jgi:hypothetical protein
MNSPHGVIKIDEHVLNVGSNIALSPRIISTQKRTSTISYLQNPKHATASMHLPTVFIAFAAMFATATATCCKGPPNCDDAFQACVKKCVARGHSAIFCEKGTCYGTAVSDSLLSTSLGASRIG